SVVFYKFRSAKDFDQAVFDGTGISVFDLKREIIVNKKLGKGTDFDIAVYNAQTNEEYVDDSVIIPRNTSILVNRNPASRPGKGTAQRYLNNAMPMQSGPGGGTKPAPAPAPAASTADLENMTEEERIQAMFSTQDSQWQQDLEKMSTKFGGGFQNFQNRAPRPGYICYRCGQKGHFINQCPTIGDKEFDRPKLKRTTGIPRIFLKPVEDKNSAGAGVMVTQNGEFVVAAPNRCVFVSICPVYIYISFIL
ncbi:DWNN domain-containing protein, partial [Chytridium lagenaria]